MRNKIISGILSCILICGTSIPSFAEQLSEINIDMMASVMDVTVPTQLPISVDNNGESITEVTAKIINYSDAQVEVTSAEVVASDGWIVESWSTDWSKAALGVKEFAFRINDKEVGIDGVVNIDDFSPINGNGGEFEFSYEGRIAPQLNAGEISLGYVVFTFGWVIAEPPEEEIVVDYNSLAPGLYETGSNYQTMLIDWDTLMANSTFKITSGVISNGTNSTSLAGDLVISKNAGITKTGSSFLGNHDGITGIVIPSGVTKIDSYGFMGCDNLEEVILPSTLKHIQAGVGNTCPKLTSIRIPTSLIYLGTSCLHNITDVYYAGTESQWNAIERAATGNGAPLKNLVTVHYE